MPVKKNIKEFLKQVKNAPENLRVVMVPAEVARDVAKFVENVLDGAARGGANARGKSGRKIEFDTPAHEANRRRVAKSRGKKDVE